MSLPANPDEAKAFLLKLASGNPDAAKFLEDIASVARYADNLVDGDSLDPQADMVAMLHTCLVSIPNNPFYRAHFASLATPITDALTAWELSDEMRVSDDRKRETFGYVWREATDKIGVAVAYLTGGFDHARASLREIYEVCHAPFEETVADWVKE